MKQKLICMALCGALAGLAWAAPDEEGHDREGDHTYNRVEDTTVRQAAIAEVEPASGMPLRIADQVSPAVAALRADFQSQWSALEARVLASDDNAEILALENEMQDLRLANDLAERQLLLQEAIAAGDEFRAENLREVLRQMQAPVTISADREAVLSDAQKRADSPQLKASPRKSASSPVTQQTATGDLKQSGDAVEVNR